MPKSKKKTNPVNSVLFVRCSVCGRGFKGPTCRATFTNHLNRSKECRELQGTFAKLGDKEYTEDSNVDVSADKSGIEEQTSDVNHPTDASESTQQVEEDLTLGKHVEKLEQQAQEGEETTRQTNLSALAGQDSTTTRTPKTGDIAPWSDKTEKFNKRAYGERNILHAELINSLRSTYGLKWTRPDRLQGDIGDGWRPVRYKELKHYCLPTTEDGTHKVNEDSVVVRYRSTLMKHSRKWIDGRNKHMSSQNPTMKELEEKARGKGLDYGEGIRSR